MEKSGILIATAGELPFSPFAVKSLAAPKCQVLFLTREAAGVLRLRVRGRALEQVGCSVGLGVPAPPARVCRGRIRPYLGAPRAVAPGKSGGSSHPPAWDPGGAEGRSQGCPRAGGLNRGHLATSPKQAPASQQALPVEALSATETIPGGPNGWEVGRPGAQSGC